tara:strand:- start:459 stop:803 length:345 start_codon:yes stop_codon:yes gene_type:complete
MSYFFNTSILLGLGVISGVVYTNFEKIKIEYLKQKGIFQVENLTINFFVNLLKKDKNISLDKAILLFENANSKYVNLEDFAKSKHRTLQNYRDAYYKLFEKAKIKNKLFNEFFN